VQLNETNIMKSPNQELLMKCQYLLISLKSLTQTTYFLFLKQCLSHSDFPYNFSVLLGEYFSTSTFAEYNGGYILHLWAQHTFKKQYTCSSSASCTCC